MKKNIATIYSLHWDAEYLSEREKWFVDRKEVFSYQTNCDGESAAEHAFYITNTSESYLTEEDQLMITNSFPHNSLPFVKTGDIVKVESVIRGTKLPDYYLCKPYGWEKFDGDRIPLLKHLLW